MPRSRVRVPLSPPFKSTFRAGAFPGRFIQQRESLRDSPATARRTQLEASFGIEIRQQNGGHLFEEFGDAHLARFSYELEAGPLLIARRLHVLVSSTLKPREVCALHRQQDYDLILLDLQMPDMDGFQLMAALRTHVAESYLPVIVPTARPLKKAPSPPLHHHGPTDSTYRRAIHTALASCVRGRERHADFGTFIGTSLYANTLGGRS